MIVGKWICSFCGRSNDEVNHLVAANWPICICELCIAEVAVCLTEYKLTSTISIESYRGEVE